MSPTGDESKKTVSVEQRTEPSVAISRKHGDETIATHSQDAIRTVSAEKNTGGKVAWQVAGKRPQNDEDELSVCSAIVQELNREAEEWDQPIPIKGTYWDCECVHRRDRKRKLLIQVTRVGNLWERWGREGAFQEPGASIEFLADAIMAAIRLKVQKHVDWSNVVLALDATSVPQHTLTAVVQAFSTRHGASAMLAGFKEIWLIGPDSATTHRVAPQK